MSATPTPKPLHAKKKKRTQDDQHNLKKFKYATDTTKKPLPYENTLSPPIKEALHKFREASEQELTRLRKEGLDPSAAINKLVEKMRTIESDETPCFSRQELDLVMEMSGINEEGAMRALILRSELAKLRHDGFDHPEAINELARRMKRLAGSKRRISLSLVDGALTENKLRKIDMFLPSTTMSLSRVSFTQLDPPDDAISSSSEVSGARKRLQDAIMVDEEGWGLRKRQRLFDKEISDSEDSDEAPFDSELYHYDDVGEFSQDEEGEKGEREVEGDDLLGTHFLEDIPLFSTFSADYPSSDEAVEYDEPHPPPITATDHKDESDSDDWTLLTSSELFSTTNTPPNSSSTSTTFTSTPTPPPTITPRIPASRIPRTMKQRDSPSNNLTNRTIF